MCVFSFVFSGLWEEYSIVKQKPVRKKNCASCKTVAHKIFTALFFEPPDGLENCFSCLQMKCMINFRSVVYRRRRTFQLLHDEA